MTRRFILSIAAVLAIGACSDQQEPNTDGSTPGSEFASTSGTKSINVALKGPATAAQLAELAKYGNVKKQLPAINALFMSGTEASLASIRALPFVAVANFDAERNAPPADTLQLTDFTAGFSTWNLDAVNVTLAPGPTRVATLPTGAGVYVAILDTGLLPTWRQYFPLARIAVGLAKTFGGGASNGNVSEPPNKWEQDVNSHGTHVTSTVIGYNLNGAPINGVAPMATVIPVKVLNQNGSGWSSAIAEGIVYIGRLTEAGGALAGKPVVINMSLGGSVLDAVEKAAIDYAIGRGVVIVASAGNSGDRGMGYPGAYEPVISSAASGWAHQWTCSANPAAALIGYWWNGCNVVDPTNTDHFYIADFSSREKTGQDLDVVAPGSWVVGPYQINQSGRQTYYYLSGTSMASPHVAGIVALMKQNNPGMNALQAETKLQTAAIPLPAGCRTVREPAAGLVEQCWENDATGHGLITADAALAP